MRNGHKYGADDKKYPFKGGLFTSPQATVAAATATAAAGRATAAAARARATVAITFVLQGQYVCVMAYAIRLYAGTETTEDSP